jgi:endoglucanase Acf2
MRAAPIACAAGLAALLGLAHAMKGDNPLAVGRGSLAAAPPPGQALPQPPRWVVPELHAPIPTNRWWSSLVALPFSERQYPHPLAVVARAEGLQVRYPGPSIRANEHCICGWMDFEPPLDLILGHSAVARFTAARLARYSDWFVTARFEADGQPGASFDVSYGHGSPFVFASYRGGDPTVAFTAPPEVFHKSPGGNVLGVCHDGRCYLLAGPAGSHWSGLDQRILRNHLAGPGHFALGLLPDGKREDAVALFTRYAFTHVVDTRVAWSYDAPSARVRTRFDYQLETHDGGEPGTLFALYPHQRLARVDAGAGSELGTYQSVRGRMSLRAGRGFTLESAFPGVLPALPVLPGTDVEALSALVRLEAPQDSGARDSYWAGKFLGRVAALHGLARQLGLDAEADALEGKLRTALESWFRADLDLADPATGGAFFYEPSWGTLIAYPGSYGSDTSLNDHHFHYGYFLRAAAELGRGNRAWISDDGYGPFLDLLVRDIANPRRDDPKFPFLRHFDPYAGHSWAAGDGVAGDGNNQESSSEAMAAWTGLILLGELRSDTALRDLGIYLYTSELQAIEAYWFDVTGENFPPDYPAPVVPMIWGGKGAYGTWFSGEPEHLYGINWLPFHGGSLYLGRWPDYAARAYDALLRARGGAPWKTWADLVVMYRALSDRGDALRQWNALGPTLEPEAGNSRANTLHWISTFGLAGHVDRGVQADGPLYAVFRNESRRTYVAYNAAAAPRTVRFSDGARLVVAPGALAVKQAPAPP